MAATEKTTKIQQLLASITNKNIDELVTNTNWGSINFQIAKPDLELLFNLCNHLKVLPVAMLPESVADAFVSSLNQAMTTIDGIKAFKIEDGNPTGARDNIVLSIKTHAEHLLVTTQGWIAFLAYQKGDVQKNIDALASALANANELLDKNKELVELKKDEINGIVAAAREASASAGVGVFTSDFDSHAVSLEGDAKKWLNFAVASAVATMLIAFALLFLPIDKDATNAQIFQYISSKLVVLAVLFTATTWCGRIYKALMHQRSVARHRANALKTFQAFVKATANESVRDAVLMETTRAIFSNSPSGYLDSTDAASDSSGPKVMEIFKTASASPK